MTTTVGVATVLTTKRSDWQLRKLVSRMTKLEFENSANMAYFASDLIGIKCIATSALRLMALNVALAVMMRRRGLQLSRRAYRTILY
jgi:hypothetical protein